MARRRRTSSRRRRSSSRRRRRSGTRGVTGLKGFKGLKSLRSKGPARDVMPGTLGLVLAGGSTLALRSFVEPTPGSNQATIYRWAPAIGAGVAALGALAIYGVAGGGPATATALTGAGTAALLYGSERVHLAKGPGAIAALRAGGGEASASGTAGMRAIVPERPDGMGAVVMEELKGPYGQDLSLQGAGMAGTVDESAFGTESYR